MTRTSLLEGLLADTPRLVALAGGAIFWCLLASGFTVVNLRAAPPVRVEGLDGRPVDPLTLQPHAKAAVFLFVSVDCPISNRYAPDIQRLQSRFTPSGVQFMTVYVNPYDHPAAIAEHQAAYGYPTDVVRDPSHSLAAYAGITTTPEAAVITPDGALVYRGRIDDRYVSLGIERPVATRHDLAEALTDVLAGLPVRLARTPAVGCYVADFAR